MCVVLLTNRHIICKVIATNAVVVVFMSFYFGVDKCSAAAVRLYAVLRPSVCIAIQTNHLW